MDVPVLASGSAMEINYDFNPILLCPSDSFGQVVALALEERLTWADIVCPVADWDANVIQSINRHELALESGVRTP